MRLPFGIRHHFQSTPFSGPTKWKGTPLFIRAGCYLEKKWLGEEADRGSQYDELLAKNVLGSDSRRRCEGGGVLRAAEGPGPRFTRI